MSAVTETHRGSSEASALSQIQNSHTRGFLIVSRTTIDYTPEGNTRLPLSYYLSLHRPQPGDKVSRRIEQLDRMRRHGRRGADFKMTVGGNGPNIAHRLSELLQGETPVTVFTWGDAEHADLLSLDLTHPRKGMFPKLEIFDGRMPQALVFPVRTQQGIPDRIIYSSSPNMPSEFAHVIDGSHEYVILNSLGGKNWRRSLYNGTDALNGLKTTKSIVTPGTAQLNAVKFGDNPDAVYYTMKKASSLIVNKVELRTLVAGSGRDPADSMKKLLAQGLDLGPTVVIASDGANGVYGASQAENRMIHVTATTPDILKSTLGCGDALLAGVVFTPDAFNGALAEALINGSISASFAAETIGAHVNPPSVIDLATRRMLREPKVTVLYEKPA